LNLSGAPNGQLDIMHTTGSTFTVKDNGVGVGAGSYNILGSLTISMPYRFADVKIDLNGGTIPGSVTIGLGNGFVGSGTSSVDIYDSSLTGTGTVGGTVTILQGDGHETLDIGAFRDPVALTTTPEPIRISGNLTVAASSSSGSFGNALNVAAGTNILGTVQSTLFSEVAVGSTTSGAALTTIGGGLTINDYSSLRALQAVVTGVVDGSLAVTGTELDDIFALQQFTSGGGLVKGNLNVNLEDGQSAGDRIVLDDNTMILGNAQLTAGANTNTSTGDQFEIFGTTVLGASGLTVQMGNNTNSLDFTAHNIGGPLPFIADNMTITAGNGNNIIGMMATGTFDGTIGGNLSITLGSGDNGLAGNPIVIEAQVGKTLTWHSGNGPAVVQLGNFSTDGNSESYTVSMVFGNDDDSVTVDIGAGTITGTINEGGRQTANTFTLLSGNEAPGFQVLNVP